MQLFRVARRTPRESAVRVISKLSSAEVTRAGVTCRSLSLFRTLRSKQILLDLVVSPDYGENMFATLPTVTSFVIVCAAKVTEKSTDISVQANNLAA